MINGPPICHLHAGGNLYREISDQQCLSLLRQSIDTFKVYANSINIRPTVVALPKSYKNTPKDLEPRLKLLQAEYAALVKKDRNNKVLGPVNEYYKFYSREQLESLSLQATPSTPACSNDWMIPIAKNIDFNQIQFPVLLVQEYGLSIFRLAAIAELATEKLPECNVRTCTQVTNIKASTDNKDWHILLNNKENSTEVVKVNYLINACGFKTGAVDDMLNLKRERMVEFKSAYLAHWGKVEGKWPEVVIYGERGTPQGMAQLTPCKNGYFQLHGMTEEITLFKGGLAHSGRESAQPRLAKRFLNKIYNNWPAGIVLSRTQKSIQHIGKFLPAFNNAVLGGEPLFGAQQIPGDDPKLRVADVSFSGDKYACIEIVKASSALDAADLIVNKLIETKKLGFLEGVQHSVSGLIF
ncbi:FAD-dependent oxidoreductase [Psychrobium sp. nBUS_13]|uniref:FAD-dependent oxidoreductase n=1 Tax=Psychrobium sp. nBUS_13 TaxID=3395319 RepID=UPI003EB9C544